MLYQQEFGGKTYNLVDALSTVGVLDFNRIRLIESYLRGELPAHENIAPEEVALVQGMHGTSMNFLILNVISYGVKNVR
jgi:hypothetical protein